MNVATRLYAAADLIERQGLAKGTLELNGAHCAVGAIYEVARWNETGSEALQTLATVLKLPDTAHIPNWNNAPEQTQENVVAGLRFAALWWEEQQVINGSREVLTTTQA